MKPCNVTDPELQHFPRDAYTDLYVDFLFGMAEAIMDHEDAEEQAEMRRMEKLK